jgi:hypothetical protein
VSLCGLGTTPPRPYPTHHRACIHQSLHCHTCVSKPRGDACQRRCLWLWLCLFTRSLTLLLSGHEKRVRVEDSVCVCVCHRRHRRRRRRACSMRCSHHVASCQRLLPRLPRDVKAVCTVCDALLIDVHGVRVCVCACVRVDEGQWCTCTTSTNTASFPPSLAPSRAPPPTTATPLSMIYIGAVVYVAVVACQCDYFMV